jgi:hypothetical protein
MISDCSGIGYISGTMTLLSACRSTTGRPLCILFTVCQTTNTRHLNRVGCVTYSMRPFFWSLLNVLSSSTQFLILRGYGLDTSLVFPNFQ